MEMLLFPTADFREVGVSFYGFEAENAPLMTETLPAMGGIELMTRKVSDTQEAMDDEDESAMGEWTRVRIERDANGEVHLEQLEMSGILLNVRVRPELGDTLDVGFPGTWESVFAVGMTPRTQWRAYTPSTITLLGFANTDMDSLDRVRYYAAVGTGLGVDGLVRVVGPIGLHARAELEGSARRTRGDDHYNTRQEVAATAELGLAFITDKKAWELNAWGESVSQWEPWDEGGRDGMDRQYFAAGARVGVRMYKDRDLSLELDPRDMLEHMPEELPGGEIGDLLGRKGEEEQPEGVEGGLEGGVVGGVIGGVAGEPAWMPKEVHWSEVEVVAGPKPKWPEGTPPETTCKLRFSVDPTGTPYDVQVSECAAELVAPAMEAGWAMRFAPVSDGAGGTTSATFVYPVSGL